MVSAGEQAVFDVIASRRQADREGQLSNARLALRNWRRARRADDPVMIDVAGCDMERALRSLVRVLS